MIHRQETSLENLASNQTIQTTFSSRCEPPEMESCPSVTEEEVSVLAVAELSSKQGTSLGLGLSEDSKKLKQS